MCCKLVRSTLILRSSRSSLGLSLRKSNCATCHPLQRFYSFFTNSPTKGSSANDTEALQATMNIRFSYNLYTLPSPSSKRTVGSYPSSRLIFRCWRANGAHHRGFRGCGQTGCPCRQPIALNPLRSLKYCGGLGFQFNLLYSRKTLAWQPPYWGSCRECSSEFRSHDPKYLAPGC